VDKDLISAELMPAASSAQYCLHRVLVRLFFRNPKNMSNSAL
jgi:hypothetical protein